MKKVLMVVVLVALVSGVMAMPLEAQAVEQKVFASGFPVTVGNYTEDQKIIRVHLAGASDVFMLLGPGRQAIHRYGRGIILLQQYGEDVMINAEVCTAGAYYAPPAWAFDTRVLGNLALTPEFLTIGTLNEENLKARAKEIVKKLETDKPVFSGQLPANWKDAKKSIEKWSDDATGKIKAQTISCFDPVPVDGTRIHLYYGNYSYTQSYTFRIVGSSREGYFLRVQ